MISLGELLSGNDPKTLPQEHLNNLAVLLDKVNQVRTAWNKPMTVSSGYRSLAHHLAIYAAKGITDRAHIPMHSKHLYGQAVDIADADGSLETWCRANETLLRSIGLWMEDFGTTTTWVHFQCVPYGSFKPGGSLWFMP
jgi:hypothetical protein